MSEAKDDYSGGDKVNASEVNQISENANDAGGFRDDKLAGETINGATLPVPVYQNTTDNEFYKCDANVSTKLNFVGFAISNSTDGVAIDLQMTGIVRGFTGLDEGEKYYVQDAVGTIGKTPGTLPLLVGKAISETELLILRETSHTNGNTTRDLTASAGVQNIAHGLGKIPKKIKLTGLLIYSPSTMGGLIHCETVYNGKIQSSLGEYLASGGVVTIATIFRIGYNSNEYQTGVVTFDDTNIIITWTKVNTPEGIVQLLWEAEG